MFIHLDWTPAVSNRTLTKEHDLKFNLPNVSFGFSDYEIRVKQCLIVWEQPANSLYGILCSTIIDKSIINPTQQLLVFSQHKKSNFLLHTPVNPEAYLIQRQDLQTAEFILTLSEKQKIEKVKLILEIIDVGRN